MSKVGRMTARRRMKNAVSMSDDLRGDKESREVNAAGDQHYFPDTSNVAFHLQPVVRQPDALRQLGLRRVVIVVMG